MSTGLSLPTPRGRSPRLVKLAIAAAVTILAMSVVLNVSASTATRISAPAVAAPDAHVSVSGVGLGSGQAGVLTYNGVVVTHFSASGSGSFSAPFIVPDWAQMDATGRISARTASGALIATTTLTIGAKVKVATLYVPDEAAPGAKIMVAGAGFGSGRTGILTINGLKYGKFTASKTGSFSVPFVLPKTTTLGTGRISAKTASKSLIATTTLKIGIAMPGSVPPPPPTPGPTTIPTAIPPVVSSPNPTADPTAAPTAAPTPAPTSRPTAPPSASLPNFSHVYMIVFENHEYSSIVGSSQAPYINSLIAQYGLATNFTAVAHPSEPNYIAMVAGSPQGVTDDGVYNLGAANVFDQIDASGRTWRAYQQGYQGNCSTVSSSSAIVDGVGKAGSYVRKHDPAISFTAISGNKSRCANITNLASFDPAAANYEFITPNLINDMHDGSIADGDNFLKAFLPKITTSSSFANSVVFVTFDEGSSNVNGGGHIVTLAITPHMTAGFKATAAYTHYSMLRTVEQAWGLPYLGNAASATCLAFPY